MSIICLKTFRDTRLIQELVRGGPVDPVPSLPAPKPKRPAAVRKRREECGGLQWYPRLKRWAATSHKVSLNPETLQSWSYSWWLMTDRVGDLVVFNAYRYSSCTSKHQSKVRQWLWNQGIEFVEIKSPGGLQDLESAENYYDGEILALQNAIEKPRSRRATNEKRRSTIATLRVKRELVLKLQTLRKEQAS